MSCYRPEDGGFGSSPRNDSHLLATLSALQILALLDALHRADAPAVTACEDTAGCQGAGRQRAQLQPFVHLLLPACWAFAMCAAKVHVCTHASINRHRLCAGYQQMCVRAAVQGTVPPLPPEPSR